MIGKMPEGHKRLAVAVLVSVFIFLLSGTALLQYSIDNTSATGASVKESLPFDTMRSILDVLGGVRETLAAYLWTKTDDVFHRYVCGDIRREEPLCPYYWLITKLDPHFTMAYYFASWELCRFDRVDEGFELALEGVRFNPYSATLRENLAEIYFFFLKDPKKARYHMVKAIQLTGDKVEKDIFVNLLRTIDRVISGEKRIPDVAPIEHRQKVSEQLEEHEHQGENGHQE